MAREKNPARDKAYEMYKEHGGDITNRKIAELLDVKEKTVSAWKSRDKWTVVLQKEIGSTTKSKGKSLNGNDGKKRGGNPNPQNQFTERNHAARKHGLFSRYIPKETLELMGMLDKSNPADLLWDQIQIQYAAIIRSQEIMFVESKDELIKEIKKVKQDQFGNEVEYEFQFAWDRQATFLNAQSKAIGELRTSIKQFNEMAHDDDERLLKLEQMRLGIDKTKAEIEKLNGGNDDGPIEIMISRKGGR